MNLKQFFAAVFLSIIASTGYAAGFAETADLASADGTASNSIVAKSAGTIPGGNAFDGVSVNPEAVYAGPGADNVAAAVAVPEPSTAALICVGAGFAVFTAIKRRLAVNR